MPKKKSAKLAAQTFSKRADEVLAFAQAVSNSGLSAEHVSWGYDLAIIRLYGYFEALMLEVLTCAINNDTGTITETTGVTFPKHLTDEVCEYLIVGTGYFDFRGREGLVRVLKRFVPDTPAKPGTPANRHYLITVVKTPQYKAPLEQMAALRNLAAHGSKAARKAAMDAIGAKQLGSAGAWLKVQNRLAGIVDPLKRLAADIEAAAPY